MGARYAHFYRRYVNWVGSKVATNCGPTFAEGTADGPSEIGG